MRYLLGLLIGHEGRIGSSTSGSGSRGSRGPHRPPLSGDRKSISNFVKVDVVHAHELGISLLALGVVELRNKPLILGQLVHVDVSSGLFVRLFGLGSLCHFDNCSHCSASRSTCDSGISRSKSAINRLKVLSGLG